LARHDGFGGSLKSSGSGGQTALDDESIDEKVMQAGCVACLHKPFPACLLIGAIETASQQPKGYSAIGWRKRAMVIRHLTTIGAAALILSVRIGQAGPCADAIGQAQAELDAKIEAMIDTARFARDARRAFGFPAPTRGTSVDGTPSDVSWMGQAVAALAEARHADRNGDSVACEQALAELRRALARP
jgi:hypothetical protein